MDYKTTINLLETPFPMRGDLVKREPQMLKKWQNRYQDVRAKCKGRTKFILHDGPPYANGQLHVGHAQNKVLKDMVIRSKTLAGFDAAFVPGWDCHGLPIEINVEKKYGKKLSPQETRAKCRAYALEQIELQKTDFMRLGIIGDWNNPYKTMDYMTEADTIRALGEIYKNGYLMRGLKPVHWCIDCGSALAEAEVEYYDKVSPAIDVAFRAVDNEKVAAAFRTQISNGAEVDAVIWTTTPWTLPANQAICAGPEVEYALVEVLGLDSANPDKATYLIIASNLVESCVNRYKKQRWIKDSVRDDNSTVRDNKTEDASTAEAAASYKIIATTTGDRLELLQFNHPFYARQVPLILGDHATADAGTGLVHTAPAHGVDDYLVGLKYKLEVHNPVAGNGCYISDTELFAGLHVFKANDAIIEVLQQHQRLLAHEDLTHSYPCCWRHKSKIIYRATAQWFISMDRAGSHGKSLRTLANDAVEKTQFAPAWGKNRLEAMINNRPDWCVSRQRNWGSPMAFFVHTETGELHPDSYNLLQKVAVLVEGGGIDAWFDLNAADMLPASDIQDYVKLSDTLDVWFDSGSTHFSVLKRRDELAFPADLYLEGSDQHRGWFQSSLLTSIAINGHAPYKQLLTHSFVVDGAGHKMSKSKGNVVSLIDAVNKFGADILRLWVASTDYTDDVGFSDEILKRTADGYRRIRNTLKFLLSNLVDFNVETDAVAIESLVEVDKYALLLLSELQQKLVTELYPSYQFHLITQELLIFCSETMGGFYLDLLKDRLYTSKTAGHARRSAQTALYHIAHSLILLLSPILCFTADEAWETLKQDDNASTLYATYHQLPAIPDGEVITQRWHKLQQLRELVLKELENHRAQGAIGSSLQANLVLNVDADLYAMLQSLGNDLKFVYMVSALQIQLANSVSVIVTPSVDAKCERCWHYVATVGENQAHPTLCARCVTNVIGEGETRTFA